MPVRQYKRSQRKNKKSKHRSRNCHTKKAGKRHTQTGGFGRCEQAATIIEPGFTITSHITDSSGLTIPSSRALLSGTLPTCNKGAHP